MGADGYSGYGYDYVNADIEGKKKILRYLMKNYHKGACIKDTIVDGIYYGVYENSAMTHKPFAVVIEPYVYNDDLTIRVESEDVGPIHDNMPTSYLKLLGPAVGQYSKGWRERVKAHSKSVPRTNANQTIRYTFEKNGTYPSFRTLDSVRKSAKNYAKEHNVEVKILRIYIDKSNKPFKADAVEKIKAPAKKKIEIPISKRELVR